MIVLCRFQQKHLLTLLWLLPAGVLVGCRSAGEQTAAVSSPLSRVVERCEQPGHPVFVPKQPGDLSRTGTDRIRLTAFDDAFTHGDVDPADQEISDFNDEVAELAMINELPDLEAIAQASNPNLIRLQQEASAASAKTLAACSKKSKPPEPPEPSPSVELSSYRTNPPPSASRVASPARRRASPQSMSVPARCAPSKPDDGSVANGVSSAALFGSRQRERGGFRGRFRVPRLENHAPPQRQRGAPAGEGPGRPR